MKMLSILLLLSAAVTAQSQNHFFASLHPDAPTSDDRGIPARAEFWLDETSVRFIIRFGLEGVVPASARLLGTREYPFELGPPMIVIHSPGPWPDGFDGSTTFSGAFSLPEGLRDELSQGAMTLFLPGSALGDFRGSVLPVDVLRPGIAVELEKAVLRFHFAAEPGFRYTLEAASSVEARDWASLTNFVAEAGGGEAVFIDSVAGVANRFYRIRKENVVSKIVGRVFIYGCPVIVPGVICNRPYAASITIQTKEGDVVARLTTDSQGRFERTLAPGHYLLVPDGAGEPGLPSVETVAAQVWPKQATTVTIVYDSGIR